MKLDNIIYKTLDISDRFMRSNLCDFSLFRSM